MDTENGRYQGGVCGGEAVGRGTDLSAWVAEVRRLLAAGNTVAFEPRGMSMWPTLRPASDTVYIQPRPEYFPMDIVLAVADEPKGVFMHRVIRAEKDRYVLMGDANLRQTEVCRPQGIVGKVVRIERDGRDVTESATTRLLRVIYRLPRPLRRVPVRILNKFRK